MPQPRVGVIQQGLEQLFQKRDHTDLIIIAEDDREVKAHKAILAARSPVFAAMLEHDLEETRTNTIEMKDVPEDVLVCETICGLMLQESAKRH